MIHFALLIKFFSQFSPNMHHIPLWFQDMEDLIEMIVTFFKDGGENASVKKAERDVNGNMVKKMGQGDGQPTGASTSSTDTSEEEFEEAKERMESAEISPTK